MFTALHCQAIAPVGWVIVPYTDKLESGDVVIYGTPGKVTPHPSTIHSSDYNHPKGFIVEGMAGDPVSSIDSDHIYPGMYYCVCRKVKVKRPPYTPSKWADPSPLP